MHWIKSPALLTAALALVGCASQETILPETEDTMLDIYRGAMTVQGQNDLDPLQAVDVCKELALADAATSMKDCEDTVREHASTMYRHIDAQPAGEDLDYLPYTREVATEIDNLFPRLDNPDIVIYVYPHLATRTRAPIPGYSTVIPLYDQVHYRLPGESQRTTPTALAGAAVTTGNPQDTPTGTGQRAPNTRSSEARYHKSSHLEGRSLLPETAPETAPDDAAGELPLDASVEDEQ
ncbi:MULTISPECIES: TIGR03751 family conjugal transfer lipoprotein [Haliea]|uniref:TIGR03751 family conjugal transfer lipoprotein n=1 Tax=Haliea TaxID=475794 RepID=UPI0018EE5AEC|nr:MULTISPECIES: TIGR03751 family conjugal transfer lipoprotein [Haliea]